jgi:hypothetical protein
MGVGQPGEEGAHFAFLSRPNDEMPVRAPKTPCQFPQGMPGVCLDHDPLERLEVGLFAKQRQPHHGPFHDVVDISAGCNSRSSRHGLTLPHRFPAANTGCAPVATPAKLALVALAALVWAPAIFLGPGLRPLGRLGTRFLPATAAAFLAVQGLRVGQPWGLALVVVIAVAAPLIVRVYRRRGPHRATCEACPQRDQRPLFGLSASVSARAGLPAPGGADD